VIVYLHGFNSSPQSHKAKLLGEYMAQRGLASRYGCPALPPLASEAVRVIEASLASGEVCFVGSSLGGFYATYLAEARGARAVLINPAIEPYVGLRAYLGPQRNLHTGQAYELTEAHLHDWEELEVPRITPSRYLLLVETGDEVLDYRQAVRRYAGCEQVVVEGGDHSLQSFPRHLARILEFAGHAALV
jgi:predicted esterase YcpF (UPF0227 family)